MNDIFDPRLDILPKAQLALWPWLGEVTALDFVLFGGTAIALQLGHRRSVDFDFFSREGLDPGTLPRGLPLIARATTLQAEPDTLTVSVPTEEGPVKLSFYGGLGFVDAARARATRDGILRVAPLNDLMATKLVVLQKRVEAKDYQDIAAMLRAGVDLADGLRRARRMYGGLSRPPRASRPWSILRAAISKPYLTAIARPSSPPLARSGIFHQIDDWGLTPRRAVTRRGPREAGADAGGGAVKRAARIALRDAWSKRIRGIHLTP